MGTKGYYTFYSPNPRQCRKCARYKSHSHIKGYCNKRGKYVNESKYGCKLFE